MNNTLELIMAQESHTVEIRAGKKVQLTQGLRPCKQRNACVTVLVMRTCLQA